MLNKNDVIEAINKGEISISISFYYDENGNLKYVDEMRLLDSSLKSNLYSDRLKLTMGPIIKQLNKKHVKMDYRFKGLKDCHDLQKTNNKYLIKPGESITILTNENVMLNGNYACLVIPRTSLSDVGIVVTTAYIDPFYKGLLRLQLSNLSDNTYELSTVEAIAQCFFFELSDTVSESFKDSFSSKSVFFGQTWKAILESDRNPFPIKKGSKNDSKASNIKYQLNILGEFFKKYSIIWILITNLLLILSGFVVIKSKIEKYIYTIDQIECSFTSKSSEILIKADSVYGEKEIIVQGEKSDIIGIIINNSDVKYKLLSGDRDGETKVIFTSSIDSCLNDDYEIKFDYAIIWRIKK